MHFSSGEIGQVSGYVLKLGLSIALLAGNPLKLNPEEAYWLINALDLSKIIFFILHFNSYFVFYSNLLKNLVYRH